METCICYNSPEKGSFIKDHTYQWTYIIDGICVFDEFHKTYIFEEIRFLWYFMKCEGEECKVQKA